MIITVILNVVVISSLSVLYIKTKKKEKKENKPKIIKIGVNYGEIKRRAKKRKIEKRIGKS